MKPRIMVVTLCIVCVVGVVSTADAQLIAGSPEDRAYTAITSENSPDAKLTKLQEFEKTFPESKVLADIYLMQMEIYQHRNDMDNVIEIGEKLLQIEAENVTALMTVARTYSVERKNLDRAVQYAERAVNAISRMKAQPAPPGYTDDEWKQYVDTTELGARNILTYARSVSQ